MLVNFVKQPFLELELSELLEMRKHQILAYRFESSILASNQDIQVQVSAASKWCCKNGGELTILLCPSEGGDICSYRAKHKYSG